MLKLNEAIDFNSIDSSKVDIIMSLFVPNDNNEMHVELLSSLCFKERCFLVSRIAIILSLTFKFLNREGSCGK